jgi:PTH1 family peptidyl-tRNA hydrolase
MSNIFDLFKKIEKTADTTPVSFIIAGLGNPGAQYDKTRHNVGFVAIDYIAEKLGVRIDRAKFHALVAEAKIGNTRVLLMKPETYMNNSGVAIGEAAAFYKISPDHVIVLHDEISFEPGIIRIRRKGSAGGHNGLKSIIAHLASEEFPRVKIGVGKKPSPEYDLADWVLGKMPKDASDATEARNEDILRAVRFIVDGKIDEAMQRYSK